MKDALEAILLVTRNYRGSPGMGSIAALATYLLNEEQPFRMSSKDGTMSIGSDEITIRDISIEPPDAGKQIMQLYDWLKERGLLHRPGSVAEIMIATVERHGKTVAEYDAQIKKLAQWIGENASQSIQGKDAVDTAIDIMATRNKTFPERRINVNPKTGEEHLVLDVLDDGTWFELGSVAGGGAPLGAWSDLTVIKHTPNEPAEILSYNVVRSYKLSGNADH